MRIHIYKIEEDRMEDRAEIYVYGAFTAEQAVDKAESILRHLTAQERRHASIYAQGFDLDTDLIPDYVLDDLDIPREFDPHELSEEQLSLLLSGIDEAVMQPPFDIPVDISKEE